MNQDLNQIFPFDITTDPEPRASAPEPTVQQTSSIQTPPYQKKNANTCTKWQKCGANQPKYWLDNNRDSVIVS